ncbi:hypothetical protein AB0D67_13145 [Streptosporangium sp. NPDC048047]|uniref:COG4315 family predicted lipoprotein n=1 Tax=Streptosporangium sp. NPDC048047 TaxID=3155748 RepID=UPI00342AC679
MKRTLPIGVLALGLLATGCGAGEAGATGPDAAVRAGASPTYGGPPVSPATRSLVGLGDTRLGKVLTDSGGRTLYLFEKDRRGRSACYGDCATVWPPYLTGDRPRAGSGARASLLGAVRRTDGTRQVTYGGHPLYRYVRDQRPGDVTGHDVESFGDEWYAVGVNGRKAED